MTANLVKVPFVDLTWQHQPILTDIEQAIQTVIKRGDFVLGQALAEFENSFARACGVQYGVGVASGTAAIAMGLQALGIGAGDEVLVPANTFVATLMGVLQAGAQPVLVDSKTETALIDLELAVKAITPRTKAIIPVHLYGQMVCPRQLLDFALNHNLQIFEDAAQAHLAKNQGYTAGSIGIAAAFSFYPSKNLGAFGNGGMLITSDPTVAEKAKTLRNYGAPSKYFHTEIGTNSRLDTLQAAILQVKLPHLPQWNQLRNQIAQLYDQLLKPLQSFGIQLIENKSDLGHVYHLYVIRIDQTCPLQRKEIQEALSQRGIQTGIHYPIPCHLQPAYSHLGYQQGDFPSSEMLCEQILSLPMYPGLSAEQVKYVVEQLSIIVGE
ncbi:erythromycin biosynthesis sensory transduction protein eryC1 [Aphanothece hegewaldii CCALA 016]|uniref:Erythromycin biosynthesis sensory transduction protein eryC1 n=1 Tax=Aphanothece hegewaldii CCALA 016 TaxID=2107694 RepID=A0A2T1M1Q1_9CHRO|nr:DegT/DnrJ/EryC1/StrS family aminotransferase [Aphanothece hegewaldii]PSF38628.1 erythromycin biosynthesis sensory transduction protein eryC1 [Aphanothece hegewaldii CCALA 016]